MSGALIQQHHKEDDQLKKDLTSHPYSSDENEDEDALDDLLEEESARVGDLTANLEQLNLQQQEVSCNKKKQNSFSTSQVY